MLDVGEPLRTERRAGFEQNLKPSLDAASHCSLYGVFCLTSNVITFNSPPMVRRHPNLGSTWLSLKRCHTGTDPCVSSAPLSILQLFFSLFYNSGSYEIFFFISAAGDSTVLLGEKHCCYRARSYHTLSIILGTSWNSQVFPACFCAYMSYHISRDEVARNL